MHLNRDVTIDRNRFLEDAARAYGSNGIVHDHIKVEFVHEEGEDRLKREFFSVRKIPEQIQKWANIPYGPL